jgi:hypothetical protein
VQWASKKRLTWSLESFLKKLFPNCTLYVAYLKKEKEDPKFAKQA